jgi:hypothetical protein
MELYNNGKVSKHLSLLCCMNHTRVGVLSLSLFVSVCVCVCLCAFDFFEPHHHEQFLYTPLQNKLRIKLDTETIPKSFSSWRSWQKKHSHDLFFLKILTEETFTRVFLLGDLDRRNNSQELFLLKGLTETFPRVLLLKILTETFPRVFFLENIIRISASTQCIEAAENEKKEVRSLLLHAFHWWIHTPTPSIWPNQTTTDFVFLL